MQSRVVKIITIFMFFFVFAINANALSVCTMSDEYRSWLSLSEEERKNVFAPPYCRELYKDPLVSKPEIKESNYSNSVKREKPLFRASVSQSYYNAMDDGYVTPVKNQLATNSCWTFAATANVETSALKEGLSTLDLAERHIEYSITRNAYTNGVKNDGINRNLDDGGNSYFSASYYFRHDGPILESSMPYQAQNKKIDINSLPKDKALLDVGKYTSEYYQTAGSCTSSQISSIKDKIVKYGSVGVSIYYSDSFLLGSTYYNNYQNTMSNHAVTIIGWDDSIPASKFGGSPSRNGAWIVKNSWGSEFGQNGYFYISYGDLKVCTNLSTFSDISVNTYGNAYNAADTLANLSFYNNSGMYLSAGFNKKSSGTEYIDKVSFEVNEGNRYTVYLATNNLLDKGSWRALGSGTAANSGVESIHFSPIALNGPYKIIVHYQTEFVPMMCKMTSSSDMHYYMNITRGMNHYSTNGTNWTDLGNVVDNGYSGCEPVIYAYTKSGTTSNPTFNITSIVGSSKDVYTFSDDYYTVNVTSSNILSYELFNMVITNASGTNVTNTFRIENKLANGKVFIYPTNNTKAGNYTFKLSYNGVEKNVKFTILATLESSKYTIDDKYIYVNLGKGKELLKTTFMSNINTFGNTTKILSNTGSDITTSTSNVGTGMIFKVGSKDFIVIVKGDVSGDGKIMSNDSLIIKRHIVSLQNLQNAYLIAGEVSGDNKIMSNDALLIARFLVGLQGSL